MNRIRAVFTIEIILTSSKAQYGIWTGISGMTDYDVVDVNYRGSGARDQ